MVKLQKRVNKKWVNIGEFTSRTVAWLSVFYKTDLSIYRVKGEIKDESKSKSNSISRN